MCEIVDSRRGYGERRGLFTWIIHRYTSCRIKTAIGRINSQHKQVEWGGKVNIADDQLISQSAANFTNHTFNVLASIVSAVEFLNSVY